MSAAAVAVAAADGVVGRSRAAVGAGLIVWWAEGRTLAGLGDKAAAAAAAADNAVVAVAEIAVAAAVGASVVHTHVVVIAAAFEVEAYQHCRHIAALAELAATGESERRRQRGDTRFRPLALSRLNVTE